jgi:hypothetical protein
VIAAYFDEPPDAPPVLGPPIEPLPLGEVVEPLECGAELLPEEPLGPQSFIAVVLLLSLPLVPLLFELGLLVLALGAVVLPVLLAPGLLAAELLPGGQSLLDRLPDVPDIEPLVPVLAPDLSVVAPVDPVAPVVPVVVWAIAAVPRVSAMIDAAVRRRRFIRSPPLKCGAPPGERPPGRSTANRGLRRHVPIYPESGPAHGAPRPPAGPAQCKGDKAKKKGRIEMRPKFREEKPEGLAVRSGGPARTAQPA